MSSKTTFHCDSCGKKTNEPDMIIVNYSRLVIDRYKTIKSAEVCEHCFTTKSVPKLFEKIEEEVAAAKQG